jgi:penicillin-binding protein 2
MVLINNLNYRQHEEVEIPNEPGNDIYLTIDMALQKAAEQALAAAQPDGRGAVVVMDPRNGDILAMASAPSFDPNLFVLGHFTPEESARLNDPKYTPQINRAMSGAYPPGSTFKIITGIACLESGLDP